MWWSAAARASKNPQSKRSSRPSRRATAAGQPEWFQALAYESARVLFAAIEKAGSARPRGGAQGAPRDEDGVAPAGRELEFKPEFGQQVQNPFVVQQNQPDGTAPIIFPHDAAGAAGVAANPHCPK